MTAAQARALLLLLPMGLQETHRFRVEVNRVHLDVFVTREGRAVDGLAPEDFEVLDDGVKQAVVIVDVASVPRTFAVLLDESGSVSGRSRELLSEAVLSFTRELKPEDELAVLSFAEGTRLRKPLGSGRALDQETLFEIQGSGRTALRDAVFLALAYLRNARGRPILVIFTDGVDNASWSDGRAVLESARLSEALIYNVIADAVPAGAARTAEKLVSGGGSGRSLAVLEELASLTGGRTLDVERPEELSRAFQTILSEVSTRHVLSFAPRPGAKPGWHALRVKVKGFRDADVRARAGYFLDAR